MTVRVSPELLKQVKGIALRTRGVIDTLFAGESRSVFRGQGMEFAEVRAYEIGDDYRAIDWNVSARLGSPFIKTFTEERELTLLLMVDLSGSTRVGDPVPRAMRAVEIAAVLALAGVREQDRVGGLLFTDRVEHVIRPAKGRRHALRLIRDLLAFAPERTGTDLGAALLYASKVLRHRGVVVLVSDFLAGAWDGPLQKLASRHDVTAVTIDDRREVTPTGDGWFEFEDPETGVRRLVDLGDPAVRARWTEAATARVESRNQRLRAAGVRHLAIDVGEDYAPLLRRTFSPRRRAGRR
ncbi:MAG: DUF58 domain-containing protein [Gemmatimonadales bacterium]|nr:DUF58 domain-containing protein [Gemmatimonadales bacterium]